MQSLDWPATFYANIHVLVLLTLIWWTAWLYSTWHCLYQQKGVDRLTWLVALIGIPIGGVIFYWIKGADENPRRALKGIDSL